MPLEGIRAWIGEVERKLGMRTRVFLVLATIAIGGAGAAIYLAIDTRDAAVSESDVRELQEQLEAQIAGGATSAAPPPAESSQAQEPAPGAEPEAEPKSDQGATAGVAGDDAAKSKLRELVE